MHRQDVLGIVEAMPTLIEHETQRLQQMRDNDKLPDPSTLPVLSVDKHDPVTPHVVTMSAELLIRNAALKAIGDCKNFADETNAKANIELAKAKLYEAGNMVEPKASVKVAEAEQEKPKTKEKASK